MTEETKDKKDGKAEKEILSEEAWWDRAPEKGETEADLDWSILRIYTDGTFERVERAPTEEEMAQRKNCLFEEPDQETEPDPNQEPAQ